MKKMNTICLVLCFLGTFATVGYAQEPKIEIKKNEILVDGVAIAKVEREKSLRIVDITFKNMDGKELIFAKINSVTTGYASNGMPTEGYWYEMLFMDSGKKLEYQLPLAFGVETAFIKTVTKAGLIKNGAIDPEAERLFFMKYGDKKAYDSYRNPPPIAQSAPSNTTTVVIPDGNGSVVVIGQANPMAQRDRNAPIKILGLNIEQGGVIIGTLQQDAGWDGMNRWRRLTVLHNNGQQAAQAYFLDARGLEEQYTVTYPNGNSQVVQMQIAGKLHLDNNFVNFLIKSGRF